MTFIRAALAGCLMAVTFGCVDGTTAAAGAAQSGYASGRVTMADGSPLRGEIQDVAVYISGVTEAGERVSYGPVVKPDGTYRQKLAPGQYRYGRSTVTVRHGDQTFILPLEPVGRGWDKNQDAGEGIAQNFVWKVTGPTPYGQQSNRLDPTNATHWYGMSIGLRAASWRNDTNAAPPAIPDGTRLVLTLKPLGASIDGRELQPVTVERTFEANAYAGQDINDLPPAPYEVAGVATLPDGTTRPLLILGKAPGYAPAVRIGLEKDNLMGTMYKPILNYVLQ